jgi:hypothetical protein
MPTKSTLIFTTAAWYGQCAFATAGSRSPTPRPERCTMSEGHEASLDAALRMHGRSTIQTHTERHSICRDGQSPGQRGNPGTIKSNDRRIAC